MLLLDTHTLHWWTTDSRQVSAKAAKAIEGADELAVSAISWYELAWLANRGRIVPPPEQSVEGWLKRLSESVLTLPLTPAIAHIAATFPDSFPKDPFDRMIYATAIEHGCRLVTKDTPMRRYRYRRPVTVW